jgi:hypothetical protein
MATKPKTTGMTKDDIANAPEAEAPTATPVSSKKTGEKIAVTASAKTSNVHVHLLKKVTAKILHDIGVDTMDLLCIIKGRGTKLTDYGESTCFLGDFCAIITHKDGTVHQYRAGKMFAPGILEDTLNNQLDQFSEDDDYAVQTAFRVGLDRNVDKKNARGYVYTVEPLVEMQQQDPLGALASLAGVSTESKQTALPLGE